MIGNGHHIKLSRDLSADSPFDMSFESAFDEADSNFSSLIEWLSNLRKEELFGHKIKNRFIPEKATEEKLRILTECAVSLAVRSPMNREASVALAERLRGRIPSQERNALIGLNMRNSQRMIADSIGCNGKFAILFSNNREFIFGDGIFNNISGCVNPPHNPRIIVPFTPMLTIVISKPTSYRAEPRISTIVLTDSEVECCNHGVQVYSKDALFFREHEPLLTEAFTCGQRLQYDSRMNPLDQIIDNLPGVDSRQTFF